MKQKICFQYDGSEEQRVAFEVWNKSSDLPKANPMAFVNHYLTSNGYAFNEEPSSYQVLPPTEWLAQMRPIEVGDTVEVLEDREWDDWLKSMDSYIGRQLIVDRISKDGKIETKPFYFRPHRLRLIKKAQTNPTTWQPKWGEEVEIGVHGVYEKCKYIGKSPHHYVGYNDNGVVWAISIRPIPKPKTLREEVEQWLMDETFGITTNGKTKLRSIIDRHEKGGDNGAGH